MLYECWGSDWQLNKWMNEFQSIKKLHIFVISSCDSIYVQMKTCLQSLVGCRVPWMGSIVFSWAPAGWPQHRATLRLWPQEKEKNTFQIPKKRIAYLWTKRSFTSWENCSFGFFPPEELSIASSHVPGSTDSQRTERRSEQWTATTAMRQGCLVTRFSNQIVVPKEGVLRTGREAQPSDLENIPKTNKWTKSRTQADLQRAYSLSSSPLSSPIVISNSKGFPGNSQFWFRPSPAFL